MVSPDSAALQMIPPQALHSHILLATVCASYCVRYVLCIVFAMYCVCCVVCCYLLRVICCVDVRCAMRHILRVVYCVYYLLCVLSALMTLLLDHARRVGFHKVVGSQCEVRDAFSSWRRGR